MSVADAPAVPPEAAPSESIAKTLPQMLRLPSILPLTGAVLMLGLALSFAAPFMSLFAVRELGMTPLQLGLYLTVNALSAVVVSTQLGRWTDRRARSGVPGAGRRPVVLLTLGAGVLAYLVLSRVHSVLGAMAAGALLLSFSSAAFPQLFSYARSVFAAAPGELPERATTLLRSVFSFAWVVGPGVGAAVLGRWSYGGVFVVAAGCFACAALALLSVRGGQREEEGAVSGSAPAADAPSKGGAVPAPVSLRLVVIAFVLYGMAMTMGMSMFPLFITEVLRGSEAQVGFLVGLCALLEIPVMLWFVLARQLPRVEWLIKAGLALFVLHFALIYLAQGQGLLIATQAVRAVVLAILAGLGMTYFQQLMPGRFGVATTLYSNTTVIGGMLAGIAAGSWAQFFGYRAVFLLCALLSLLSWGLMAWATRRSLRNRLALAGAGLEDGAGRG